MRALVLLAALATSGCAMKGDVRDLQDELRLYAARQDSVLTELRRETLSTQDTLRTQGDQMVDFRGDISSQLRSMDQRLRQLEALAGQIQRDITALRAQQSGGGGSPFSGGGNAGGGAPGGGERLVSQSTGSADDLWSAAMAQYDRGSLNTASMAFRQFVEEHSGDPRSPDAHYYLADILSQQDRPADALEGFLQIPALFPTAQKVPDTLYRIAVLQIELGQTGEARVTLERIINTYPGTTMAMLARDKLGEIG